MKRKGNIDSSDRRVRYTKMMIRQSFLSLISERPISKISVTDICNQADLNRGTFYAYYKDPNDLYQQIKESLLEEIETPIESIIDTSSLYDLLLKVFTSIEQNKDLCTIVLSNNSDQEFISQILNLVRNKFIGLWHERVPMIPLKTLNYLFTFTANGSMGVLKEWLTNDVKDDTPEMMAALVEQMSSNAFLSYLTGDHNLTK